MTLGQLVEVVGSVTADLADLATVLDHVLRDCSAKRLDRRGAELVRIAWP